MVKGGYPYVFEFEELVSFSIHADWISGRFTLTRHDNTLSDEYEIITFSDGVTNVEYTRVDPSTGFLPPIEVEGKEVSVSVKNPGTKPEYPLLYERYYGHNMVEDDYCTDRKKDGLNATMISFILHTVAKNPTPPHSAHLASLP